VHLSLNSFAQRLIRNGPTTLPKYSETLTEVQSETPQSRKTYKCYFLQFTEYRQLDNSIKKTLNRISTDRIIRLVFNVVKTAKKQAIKCAPDLTFILINKETHFPDNN